MIVITCGYYFLPDLKMKNITAFPDFFATNTFDMHGRGIMIRECCCKDAPSWSHLCYITLRKSYIIHTLERRKGVPVPQQVCFGNYFPAYKQRNFMSFNRVTLCSSKNI